MINLTVEAIATVCHEANRAFCRQLGDVSQLPWNQAEPWQRDSAIKGVQFKLDHPEATPAEQHANWVVDKLADGWTRGPSKDLAKKTHPCLLPYDQLPLEQQAKDALFTGIVNALKPLLPL